MFLRFYRELDRRWYVDLPSWPGEKADLEMVWGADEMCEILSKRTSEALVRIELEPFDGCAVLQLQLTTEDNWGLYKAYFPDRIRSLEVGLCPVTLFVFESAEFPQCIYIK